MCVTFGAVIGVSLGVSVNLGHLESTRLTAAAVMESRSGETQMAALGITGERYAQTYPQPVDNSSLTPKRLKNPRELVTHRASARGYSSKELKCLFIIIDRESDWNPKADNPNSTAFGLFQRLKLNPEASIYKQVRTGLDYIQARYGTACEALKHHDKEGWY